MSSMSKQAVRQARQLFRSCLVNGRLDQERARGVVQLILQSRRRGYLVLLKQFQRLLKLDCARYTANIESAAFLPEDLQTSVRAGLEGVYGPGINAVFTQNSALIGGMRIKIGSDVYDGSVQAGLVALEKKFE